MSLPKEPRQKMINMMYLVLTALLALNVSAEILNAFKTVDRSLMIASGVAEQKNQEIFKSFKAKLEDPTSREKAAIWEPKAQQVKKISDELYNYIETLKSELKKESGLKTVDGKEEFKEDDLDAGTRLLVQRAPEGKEKGKELFEKLKAYKEQLLSIDPEMKKEIEVGLPLDLTIPPTSSEAGKSDWSYAYFHMTPTIAAITILSKFQNDVRNSESKAVEFCHKQIGQVEIIYDQFQAFAGTNTQYLMPGEELVITAGIGAFSKAAQPSVSIDGANVSLNAEGTAEYKTRVGGSGAGIKRVRISYAKPDGTTAVVEKEIKYTVGIPAGLTVSTDKNKLDVPFIQNFLKDIYWAAGRTMDEVQTTIDASFCFGIYLDEKQIGFARVVTDYVVFAYLMDVFIDKKYRGNGYSSVLIKAMMNEPQLQQVKIWRLATSDAHFLYEKFGFTALAHPEKMMEKIIK